MERDFLRLIIVLTVLSATKIISGNRVVRLVPGTQSDVEFLQNLQDREELDFWRYPTLPGGSVDIHVPESSYARLARLLKTAGLPFNIAIADVKAAVTRERRAHSEKAPSWYSHYHPLDEIVEELKSIANQRPGVAELFSLGRSYEGRHQYAVKLRGKSRLGKRLFFINCGIHAREWISPATCMYIIKQIVSKFGKDQSVTALLDKMDFVILPVLNVDGYVYTWGSHRFWRKTRKPNNGSKCVGTDPNRNWGYKWGVLGASSNPCSETYRGAHPFSEVEIVNVAKFLASKGDRVVGYMDIHAYSQLWMFPWGYTKIPAKDNEELERVSKIAVQAIKDGGSNTEYRYGPSSVVIYRNSGGSKDYTYGSLGIKYSFAVELRDKGAHGFLLPRSQIVPTGLETFRGIKALAAAIN